MAKKDEKANVADDPETALEKSGSVDERIPEPADTPPTTDTMVAGAPAAYIPQMGIGLPAGVPGVLGEGEAVLENERKAQRARGDIQRG